jgi:hypothetical protein
MVGLAWGLGWRFVQMTAGHLSPLYFPSVKKRRSFKEPEHRAELSYIFSYVANKAFAGCTIMKKHSPMYISMYGYHLQISGYFEYSFMYTCILFVVVTGII